MTSPTSQEGHQAPAGYNATAYPSFAVTVDLVVITFMRGEPSVVLIRRSADPYAGRWALPGGFKTPDETLDEAARRELLEETGVETGAQLVQSGAYGDPGRDPRSNVVTVAYAIPATPSTLTGLRSGGDAADAALIPIEAIHNGTVELAFDHRRILNDAVESLAVRLEHSGIAPAFLDEPFTLTELRRVYERLWGEELNAANFRRSLLPKVTSLSEQSLADNVADPTLARLLLQAFSGEPSVNASHADVDERTSPSLSDRRPWAQLAEQAPSPDLAQAVAWSSIDPRNLPLLSVVDSQGPGRTDRYIATAAWHLTDPPIRRPRRRSVFDPTRKA